MLVGNVRSWLRSWWLTVPEPRDISIVYAGIYACALVVGVVAAILPPAAMVHEVGHSIMVALGILTAIGALIGMIGGYLDLWRLERIGVAYMLAALAMFGFVVAALQVHEPGTSARIIYLGLIIAAAGALVVRYLMILRFTYRPRG